MALLCRFDQLQHVFLREKAIIRLSAYLCKLHTILCLLCAAVKLSDLHTPSRLFCVNLSSSVTSPALHPRPDSGTAGRRWSSLLMGWSKLHEVERGAVVWRIFWEGGFLPPQFDIILPSIGGVGTGGDGGSLGPGTKMSKVCCTTRALHDSHLF